MFLSQLNSKKDEDKTNEDELLELIGETDQKSVSNDSEEQEEETDSFLLRPVYVSKEYRKTIKDEKDLELEEKELEDEKQKMEDIKKKETKKIVLKYMNEEINKKDESTNNEELPDDTDNPDDMIEFENWKLRELKRIKKQAEEDEIKLNEKMEIERRRRLTDEQRKEENLARL
jgi:microfibrillar-associated protein 1